jgi:Ca-activated chloride channel family protein
MQKLIILLTVLVCSAVDIAAQNLETTQGMLVSSNKNGKNIGSCPLKHTYVKAEISGFLARVKVTQEFENNFNQPIEAVYKFPLPNNSAVDDMTMKIGERVIRAKIMKREEAKEVYETAKIDGKTASLLDQERPNIFTQQIANILPNEKIIIEISYVETLKYEDGEYEFVFPMTVGERYAPRSMRRANAAKVTPNIARSRAGHDISIEVKVDAGVSIERIRSTSHLIETLNFSANNASVKLKDENIIPNKDFILRYDVTGNRIEDAILMHKDARGGFFTLILSPPEKFASEDITPKEIVFLLDVSGSMSGYPIEKAKEAMRLTIENLNPQDTFNLITFASGTQMLFENPVPATVANLQKAKNFLATLSGGGGTEMMEAIKAALTPSDSQRHIRIVCFMTDGYVGDDMEIIGEVQKHPNARVFAFGIGSSVNRFLLDEISEAGRGDVEYVGLENDGAKAAKKFYERVRTPLLTDVSVEWNGLPVTDVYPKRIPDLFSAKPVIIHGRYLSAGSGTIYLKGNVAGQQSVREINVNLPESQKENDVLATLWARTKIDDLMSKNWEGVQNENLPKELEGQITKLGLDFRLMTQFTSFVAVEEKVRIQGGQSVKVEVPSENPEGVRTEIIQNINESPSVPPPSKSTPRVNVITKIGNTDMNSVGSPSKMTRNSGGSGARVIPKTISGGVINGKAVSLPAPKMPAAASAVGAIGSVAVQVLIDENGNVISSSAVSGHLLLRIAAENAARNSKFAPTQLSGQPIKVSGVIIYNFSSGTTNIVSSTSTPEESEPPLTPEMKKQRLFEEKLHPQILAIIENLKTQNPQNIKENFVKNGKAKIEIWLTEITPEVREKLLKSGFEVIEQNQQKFLIGVIVVENFKDLAEISEVQYVLPKLE